MIPSLRTQPSRGVKVYRIAGMYFTRSVRGLAKEAGCSKSRGSPDRRRDGEGDGDCLTPDTWYNQLKTATVAVLTNPITPAGIVFGPRHRGTLRLPTRRLTGPKANCRKRTSGVFDSETVITRITHVYGD